MCHRDSLLTWLINWQFGLPACNCTECLDLILWLQVLKGLWSITRSLALGNNSWIWVSIISNFHSRRHSCSQYHDISEHGPQKATKDPKLTRYYSRYLNIIFSTMKKGIFLTKALNYLWFVLASLVRLHRGQTAVHGLHCTEVVLLTTLAPNIITSSLE